MKIKRIQISGFRGVPPVTPPDVGIDLTDFWLRMSQRIFCCLVLMLTERAVLRMPLNGSSKEYVRGSIYFEEYSAKDNVHMKLGEPGFNQTAYIELTIVHNGNEHVVRKELSTTGLKVSESLAGLDAELQRAKDEIVVLDHEQFHKFVVAANKEKWSSFSSLIGYEMLDQLRGGFDSLTGSSLTSYLGTEKLRKDIDTQKQKWEGELATACRYYECSRSSLQELRTEFRNRLLQTNLASLSLEFPEIDALNHDYWNSLLERVKTPNDIVQAAKRLSKLQSQRDRLAAFDPALGR